LAVWEAPAVAYQASVVHTGKVAVILALMDIYLRNKQFLDKYHYPFGK
jgi:hypothetical protein